MKDKHDSVTRDLVDEMEPDDVEYQIHWTASEITSASKKGDYCLMETVGKLQSDVFNHLLRAVLVRRYYEGND